MKFSYPVGLIGWRLFARLGAPLYVRVSVMYDKEAGVLVATCDDFLPKFGIAVESETWEGINKEVRIAIEEAMEDCMGKKTEGFRLDPVFRECHAS